MEDIGGLRESIQAGNLLLEDLAKDCKEEGLLNLELKFAHEARHVLEVYPERENGVTSPKGARKLNEVWQLQSWLLIRKYLAHTSSAKSRRAKKLPGMSTRGAYDMLFPNDGGLSQGSHLGGGKASVPELPSLKKRERPLVVTRQTVASSRHGCITCLQHLISRNDKEALEKSAKLEGKVSKVTRQLKRHEEHIGMLEAALKEKVLDESRKNNDVSRFEEEICILKKKLEESEEKVLNGRRLFQQLQDTSNRYKNAFDDLNATIDNMASQAKKLQKDKDMQIEKERKSHNETRLKLNRALEVQKLLSEQREEQSIPEEEEITTRPSSPGCLQCSSLKQDIDKLERQLQDIKSQTTIHEEHTLLKEEIEKRVSQREDKIKSMYEKRVLELRKRHHSEKQGIKMENKKNSEELKKKLMQIKNEKQKILDRMHKLREEATKARDVAAKSANKQSNVKNLTQSYELKLENVTKNLASTRKMMADYMKRLSEEKLKRRKLEQKVELYQKEALQEKERRRQLQARVLQHSSSSSKDEQDILLRKEKALLTSEKKGMIAFITKSKEIQAQIREERQTLEIEREAFKKYVQRLKEQRALNEEGEETTTTSDATDQRIKDLQIENIELRTQKDAAEKSLLETKQNLRITFQRGREAELTTIKFMQKCQEMEMELSLLKKQSTDRHDDHQREAEQHCDAT